MKTNELIAEFMGVNIITIDDIRKNKNPYIASADGHLEDDLKYHSSWDWLMPVVEQCLEKHNNLIDGRDVIDTPYSLIAQALQVVSLKETYNAVVEFIKNYN